MKTRSYLGMAAAAFTLLIACNNADNEKKADNIDAESVKAIEEMMAHEAGSSDGYAPTDSGMIKAQLADKTTISIKDIDPKDSTYGALYKVLYMDENGDKMAVVYGMRRNGKMGTAIVQKEGDKPFTLPQTESKSPEENVFAKDGTSLATNKDIITLTMNGNKEIYKQIR